MFKNVASQKVAVFAWDNAAGSAKTGDKVQISAEISKDGGASAATNDAEPTELDATDHPGIYIFDMIQAETNADLIVITPVSSTTDIVLRPVIIYTQTVMRGTDSATLQATWTDAKAGYVDQAITTVDTVVDKILALLANKLSIADATGAATLRTTGDAADMATWAITDDDTDTVRTEVTWA